MYDLNTKNDENIPALIFKTLANCMVHNTNENILLEQNQYILYSVERFCNKQQTWSKDMLSAYAGFLFNLSIAVT